MNKTTAPGIGEMKTSRIVAFWVLIGLFLIAHLAPHAGSEQGDEWNNMTCAWLVAHGWVPYRDFFTHHPPFPYWFAAPAVRLFGPATETYRYTLMFFYFLALVALYRANRRSTRPFSFGLFVLFVALGHGLYWGQLYLYGGFLAFLLLVVFYEFWRYDENHPLRWSDWMVLALAVFASVGSGLVSAFPLALLAAGWAVKHFRYEERGRRLVRALPRVAVLLVPFLCAAVYLGATGALHDLYERVFRFSVVYYRADTGYAAYAPSLSPFAFFGSRISRAVQLFLEALLLRQGAADFAFAWANVCVVVLVAASGRWAMAVFYIVYVFVLMIRIGAQYSAVYMVHSLWAAAWVLQPVGEQVAALWESARKRTAPPPLAHADILRTVAAVLLLVLLGQSYMTGSLTETPPNLVHKDTAKLCAQLTSPRERIAILGGSPLIYVESDRKPALQGFCYIPTMDRWLDFRRRTIQDIESQKAPILVVSWWLPPMGLYNLSTYAPEVRDAVRRNYQPLSFGISSVYARNASFYELLGRYERTRPQRLIEIPEGNLLPMAVFGPTAVTQYFSVNDSVSNAKLEVLVTADRRSDSWADLTFGAATPEGSQEVLARKHLRTTELRFFPGRTDRTYWYELGLGPESVLRPGKRYFFEFRAPLCENPGDMLVMTAPRQTQATIGDALYGTEKTSRTVCFRLTSLSPRRSHGAYPIVEQSLARSSVVLDAGEIRQTVTAPEATTLSAVSLLLGSSTVVEKRATSAPSTSATAGTCVFEIRGSDNRPLVSQTFSPPQGEREWKTFAFSPLGLIPYERLSLVVRADRPSTPPLRLWSAGTDLYWGGGLSVAAKELDDDLCFKLYETVPQRAGLPDIVVSAADFQPAAPASISPREPLRLTLRIENRGNVATGPFWVEFFALPKDLSAPLGFAADSLLIMNLGPGEVYEQTITRALRPLSDGLYSLSVVADRVMQVVESNEENNRHEVSGKDLLVIARESQVNLFVAKFGVTRSPLRRGRTIELEGIVSNNGKMASGPFRIEFWAASDPNQRQLRFPICDPIGVEPLAPYVIIDLSQYPRTLKTEMPVGRLYIGCTVDGRDEVAEITKSDNTAVVGPLTIEP